MIILRQAYESAVHGTGRLMDPSRVYVHLYSFKADMFREAFDRASSLFEEQELKRSERFRFKEDRDSFLSGRLVLRYLLSYYRNIPVEEVEIDVSSSGKPITKGLCFNISHSSEQVLIGLARNEIGVDVEKVVSDRDHKSIMNKHFSSDEIAYIARQKGRDTHKAFYEVWTRKEAFLKAIGEGLRVPLNTFTVITEDDKVCSTEPQQASGAWYTYTLTRLPDRFKGSVCVASPEAVVHHSVLPIHSP